MVKPLPSSYQIDNLEDAEVATSFSANDFSWKDGKLSMDVFSEDLYDSAEVSKLKAGDTLIYIGEPIVVKDVNFRDSFVTVNGGIEEGGADFTAKRDGTYRGTQLDGHSTYTSLGKVTLPLAADFKLIDCGDNPTDELNFYFFFLSSALAYHSFRAALGVPSLTSLSRSWMAS